MLGKEYLLNVTRLVTDFNPRPFTQIHNSLALITVGSVLRYTGV